MIWIQQQQIIIAFFVGCTAIIKYSGKVAIALGPGVIGGTMVPLPHKSTSVLLLQILHYGPVVSCQPDRV